MSKGGRIMFGIGAPEVFVLLFIGVITGVLVVLPFWKIFSKAGFSGWCSLSQFVPILNVIALFYLAFAEWPIHREFRRLDG
jgi:hypothetical protein